MKLEVKLQNGTDVWDVSDKCKAIAKPIADKLGFSLEEFLTRLSQERLPGRPARDENNDLKDPLSVPRGFNVTACRDARIWRRVERAAAWAEMTVELFIWREIASIVECMEQDMITDAAAGNPIGDTLELEEFRAFYNPAGVLIKASGQLRLTDPVLA